MRRGGKVNKVLARQLRALRESQRVSGLALSQRLGIAQATISKIETGRLAPTIDYLSHFAHALRLERDQTQKLIRLAGVFPADEQTAEFLQFLPYDFLNLDWTQRRQRAMATSECAARVIRAYQPSMIPGLLQTPDYARCAFQLAGVTQPQRLERGVAARIERQRILADADKRFIFVLSEFALAYRLGVKQEREQQVDRLLELAERPNIQIGLIPARSAPLALPSPSFYLFDSERVYLELPHGDLWVLPSSGSAGVYLTLFNKLAAGALLGSALAARLQQIRLRIAA